MGTKIYVGGLPYSTTDAQLQEIFSAHGTVVSTRVITDKFTGQSRGFGFVEMSSRNIPMVGEDSIRLRKASRICNRLHEKQLVRIK